MKVTKLILVLNMFSGVNALANIKCSEVTSVKTSKNLLFERVIGRLEPRSVVLRVQSFRGAWSETELRAAYYHALSMGVKSEIIEDRLSRGIIFLNSSFLPPSETQAVEAYFSAVGIGVSPRLAIDRMKNGLKVFKEQSLVPTGNLNFKKAYYKVVGRGISPHLALSRISTAFNEYSSSGEFFEKNPETAYYMARAYGVSRIQAFERLNRAVTFLRERPTYNRPEGVLESFYISVVLNDLLLLTE